MNRSAFFNYVQSFLKITKNPEFENATSALTSVIDNLECEWNNDNLTETFLSFLDSTQAIKETEIFLEIFCRLLSLKEIARKLRIEEEIRDFSVKEQLVYCLQSHFEGCSTQAVQLLVKAAKKAGKYMHSRSSYAFVSYYTVNSYFRLYIRRQTPY